MRDHHSYNNYCELTTHPKMAPIPLKMAANKAPSTSVPRRVPKANMKATWMNRFPIAVVSVLTICTVGTCGWFCTTTWLVLVCIEIRYLPCSTTKVQSPHCERCPLHAEIIKTHTMKKATANIMYSGLSIIAKSLL